MTFQSPRPAFPTNVPEEIQADDRARQFDGWVAQAQQQQGNQAQARAALAQVIARPDYQNLSDQDKAATLTRAIDAADKQGALNAQQGPTAPTLDSKHRAALAWAQTPRYRGVDGSPEEIAQQNLEIQQAKAMLADYQKRYGTRKGKSRFYDEHPDLYDLARFPSLNTRGLKQERDAIDQQYGGALTQTLQSGLIDAADVLNSP